MESKLVSPLFETKRLFQLFRFCTEKESFGVPMELKQTEEQPKQFDRKHMFLVFFQKFYDCFRLFRFFWFDSKKFVSLFCFCTKILGCFVLFWFVSKQFCLFRLFRYRFKTNLKQTKIFCFWLHEIN
jgi:hypothetical protein